jgi:hypothetical protein
MTDYTEVLSRYAPFKELCARTNAMGSYWALAYFIQGKHYPSPKKRKSKMRMSKRWRKV